MQSILGKSTTEHYTGGSGLSGMWSGSGKKAPIFIQSMVPQLTELTFYYMNLVTVSRVQRNPTVKAEIQQRNFEASIPVGLFLLPDQSGSRHHRIPCNCRSGRRRSAADAGTVQGNRAQIQFGIWRNSDRTGDHSPQQSGMPAFAWY